MHVAPELWALRGDPAPQRRAQARIEAAFEEWRESFGYANLEAELGHYGGGAPLDDLPYLSALFSAGDSSAADFVAALLSRHIQVLAAHPLAQVALRHYSDPVLSSLVIARSGVATLALQAIDGSGLAAAAKAEAVSFAPVETVEHILSGTARAERLIIRIDGSDRVELDREVHAIAAGEVLHRSGTREAQILRQVPTSLVSLKLQRRVGRGQPARQFLLATGALVHQAAGTPRESRLELTAALLGRMERSDAAPLLAGMAEEEAATSLRWQALRECLALDTVTGFAVLGRIASRSGDALAQPAGALRTQLLQSYPELAALQSGAD